MKKIDTCGKDEPKIAKMRAGLSIICCRALNKDPVIKMRNTFATWYLKYLKKKITDGHIAIADH
jgi:hypothetical protein